MPIAFGVPFRTPPAAATEVALNATAYGRASFVVYWLVNFLGMAALGIACENVAMVAGQPWTSLWLVFWVVTNVATAMQPVELAPVFFRWGHAWPLHQVTEASRHILFGLHSRIGLNLGVLLTWVVVNSGLYPLCCYYMRWKAEKDKREADEEDEDRYYVSPAEGAQYSPKEEISSSPKQRKGILKPT